MGIINGTRGYITFCQNLLILRSESVAGIVRKALIAKQVLGKLFGLRLCKGLNEVLP